MKLEKVKIGQAFISRHSGKGSVYIKIDNDTFFHVASINVDEEWSNMKSNFSYSYDQINYMSDEVEIIPLKNIDDVRLHGCIMNIFKDYRS